MVILRPGFFTLDPAVGMPARKRGRAGGRENSIKAIKNFARTNLFLLYPPPPFSNAVDPKLEKRGVLWAEPPVFMPLFLSVFIMGGGGGGRSVGVGEQRRV